MSAAWMDAIRRRLVALDGALARSTLEGFETRHGLDLQSQRVVVASLEAAKRALKPDGRPLVEHHWASWCEPCVEDLARIQRLAAKLGQRADVVGISWDRFDAGDDTAEVTREKVAAFALRSGLTWPTVVVDASPADTFAALDVPVEVVPFTRVLDADGGVLRTILGPVDEADVDALLRLLES